MAAEVAPLTPLDSARPPTAFRVGGVVQLGFFVTGEPKPKGRPRFQRRGNSVHTFTDDQTLSWEQTVGWQVKQALAVLSIQGDTAEINLPLKGRTIADLTFYLPRPVSLPKKIQYPMKSRTDIDNLEKAIYDALQIVNVLLNDNIITDSNCRKRFADAENPVGVAIDLTSWVE